MTVKKSAKPAAKARTKAGDAYECRVCGYRIVVDRACGCVEEHVYLCCGKTMKKAPAKAAAKKPAKKR
jgi:hypothetical protein